MRLRGGVCLSTAYPDSVRFLYALGNEYKTIKLGLDRVGRLLEALGSPHKPLRFIHVAGTNGKGSTCAFLESSLRAAGMLTGLYTSPHLVEPTERIQVGGVAVSADEFSRAFDAVHQAAERLVSSGELDGHPTYFETLTSMAHLIFADRRVDAVVLETGMGGRLDATNVVDPELAVITPIDIDHERFLGSTIREIAFEKAGILKPRRPAAFSKQRPEALAVLEKRAIEIGAPVWHAEDWLAQDLHIDAYGSRFTAVGPGGEIPILCPLIGQHQVDNALTAIAALSGLGIAPDAIGRGIAAAAWPGRLECVRQRPAVFLDGAHNAAGAWALAQYIREFHRGRRVWMVFGAMRDKDLGVIAPLLFPLASDLILTAPEQPRAFTAAEIRDRTGETRARLSAGVADALAIAAQAGPGDVVFITGSLYVVGEARRLLAP